MKEILKDAANGRIDESLNKMQYLFEHGHSCFDIANGFYKILADMEGEIKR